MEHDAEIGIVVALPLEAAPIRERLSDTLRLEPAFGDVTLGKIGGKRVVLVTSGVGREAATRGTRLAIEGHRPAVVIAAGLCGGLDPALARGTLLLADRVVLANVSPPVATAAFDAAIVDRLTAPRGRGTLVTAGEVVATPEAKRRLRESTGAVAVDMESWWVVAEAARAGIAAHVVRAVCDTADEPIPADVASLAATRHPARLAGAALRVLWNRPSAIGDLAELREHAHAAADRLAAGIETLIGGSFDPATPT